MRHAVCPRCMRVVHGRWRVAHHESKPGRWCPQGGAEADDLNYE